MIYLALPTADGFIHEGTFNAVFRASTKNNIGKCKSNGYSLLTANFNLLLTAALAKRSEGITHFLLLHADCAPQEIGWADKMLEIMEEKKCDLLSVVIPIKNSTGLTSTALESSNYWRPRRLSMKEIFGYPETFTDKKLLLNTGCMLLNLQTAWIESVWFRFQDEIKEGVVRSIPEDWDFSRQVKAHGGLLYATREIPLIHYGNGSFSNTSPWGTVQTDSID